MHLCRVYARAQLQQAGLQKQRGQTAGILEKLVAKRADPNYATRCPAATQQEEKEKMEGLQGEVRVLDATIAQFEAEQ